MDLSEAELDRIAASRTIGLTTFGRRTARPRRTEIWWFHVDGRFIITGTVGARDWLANVLHDPRLIVHVDGYDIEATAIPVTDPEFRRTVFTRPDTSWYMTQQELEALVESAPMIEIHLAPME